MLGNTNARNMRTAPRFRKLQLGRGQSPYDKLKERNSLCVNTTLFLSFNLSHCSLLFAEIKKARDGIRTRGPRLGKAMLHH